MPTDVFTSLVTGHRPEQLDKVLTSIAEHIPGLLAETVVFHNGGDTATTAVLSHYRFAELIVHAGEPIGHAQALSQLAALAQESGRPYWLRLSDTNPAHIHDLDWLALCRTIFAARPNLAQVCLDNERTSRIAAHGYHTGGHSGWVCNPGPHLCRREHLHVIWPADTLHEAQRKADRGGLAPLVAYLQPGPFRRTAPTESVIVPEPPPLHLTPKSDRALVTVVVGDRANDLFAVSGPYMRAYADRIGADFVILRWPGHAAWPMSSKFAIPCVLDHYERIAYVDADVFIPPGAVNLFEMCEPDEFGACDEMAWHAQNTQYRVLERHQELRRSMGYPALDALPFYFNAGVMCVPKRYRDYLLPPTKPIRIDHVAEQDHTNARVADAFLAGEVKVKLLDRRCNWQWWTDQGFSNPLLDAVLHFSGCNSRLKHMLETAARHPLPEQQFAPPPGVASIGDESWYIDERHRNWLRAVLLSGRFPRVLEIGCHHGFSTAAFLDACRARKVGEVHLCEPNVTPELEALLTRYDLGDRVKLHRLPSVELLARDVAFDLVFVDGDHRAHYVEAETAFLLGANVRAVFAHDTSAAGRYPEIDGPQHLKAAFQRAGYHCLEDAVLRPGERTDRGMFFAARERTDYVVALHQMPH